jgi:hypothetical protein
LPFSLCVLVNYLVAVKLHLLPMLSTSEFRHLLVLFADAMSIPQGLHILKVILTLSKCQAQMAIDKASKSCGFMK